MAIEGGWLRTIVGKNGPIKLHTAVEYLDILLQAGSRFERSIEKGFRGFIYVVEGCLRIDGESIHSGSAVYIDDAEIVTMVAVKDSRLMWCFGRPHGEEINQHGPFVD